MTIFGHVQTLGQNAGNELFCKFQSLEQKPIVKYRLPRLSPVQQIFASTLLLRIANLFPKKSDVTSTLCNHDALWCLFLLYGSLVRTDSWGYRCSAKTLQ